jgi:hypothetical protein
MLKSALRNLAAVCLGLIVAFLLLIGVELFSAVVHPVPPGFGGTQEEMCQHVARYPPWVLGVVVPMWAIVAFLGTWTAGRIGNVYADQLVGLLLVEALVFNLAMLPYPVWFKIANLCLIPIAILVGSRTSKRQTMAGAAAVD